jgi:hypothetical protein
MVDLETPPVSRDRTHRPVGTWLSLVEHSLGVRGVGSSNLPVPTKIVQSDSAAYKSTYTPLLNSASSRNFIRA